MLALIIPSKESCTINNVDVYLQPMINELQLSWKGVVAFDAYLGAKFNLKAMCMWSIHDFLAYGLVVGGCWQAMVYTICGKFGTTSSIKSSNT
jgi:hypothetical protein